MIMFPPHLLFHNFGCLPDIVSVRLPSDTNPMYKLFDHRRTMYSLLHDIIITSGSDPGKGNMPSTQIHFSINCCRRNILLCVNWKKMLSIVFNKINNLDKNVKEKNKENNMQRFYDFKVCSLMCSLKYIGNSIYHK